MAACHSCHAEVVPGTRWCGICHSNLVDPKLGHLASPGKRLAAYFLDGLVPLVAFMLILVVAGVGSASGSDSAGSGGAVLGLLLLLAYVVWAFTLFSRGTTPGKRLLGMSVIKENGQRAGFFTMLIRESIGKAISAMVFSLGFLWILIDRDNQGWHDKLVSTYVVR